MSQTVTIRFNDDQVAALRRAAAAAGLPPSTLAAALIDEALAARAGRPPVDDGPLVAAVRGQLADAEPVQLEALTLLARQAERGSTAAAGRLLGLLRQQVEADVLAAAWRDQPPDPPGWLELPPPECAVCERCRGEMSYEDRYGPRDAWPMVSSAKSA